MISFEPLRGTIQMSPEIEITVGDVTDIEARVIARYLGPSTGIELNGTLRGPFCEHARTLPAELVFHRTCDGSASSAEAIVPDPCMWTPEMPHLYQADLEARRGSEIVAEYHGPVGLRRLAPRRPVDFAPGTG
jgi:glycosyl hydrolase family 2